MKLLTIYGSSRRHGNTESLTRVVLDQLDQKDYSELFLLDHEIKPIVDERHTESGFTLVDDDYEELAKALMEHEAILFVTPLYWYGMSGRLKNFIDRWSQSIRSEDYDFKARMEGKKIYVLVVGGTLAPFTALPLIQQFQLIGQFLNMEFGGYAIGKGVKPKEVLEDKESVILAEQLGKKIKDDLLAML